MFSRLAYQHHIIYFVNSTRSVFGRVISLKTCIAIKEWKEIIKERMKIRSNKICIRRLKIFNVPSKVGEEEDRSRFDTITIEHCNIVTDIILLEAFSQRFLSTEIWLVGSFIRLTNKIYSVARSFYKIYCDCKNIVVSFKNTQRDGFEQGAKKVPRFRHL